MKTSKALLIIILSLAVSSILPSGFSDGYSQTYELLNNPDGSTYYRLNVTIQQSLYEYYAGKSHSVYSNNDFAKFVTPYALQPIANSLLELYSDDEDFTNGVLMIVHQIPYEVTTPAKYPVETMIENKGDCDLFSYIAASILKANGIDVVLLYYESQAHMNIGVNLSHDPHDTRDPAYYVTYNSIRYYVAEATGGNWEEGWRVGECPEQLKNAPLQVITLENSEQSAPGQVSASYRTLASSTLSLVVSSAFLIQGSALTFSGQLNPALQNESVTIYIRVNESPWKALGTAITDNNGYFTHVWDSEEAGICYIRASWSGDADHAGADSPIQTVTILSTFFLMLLVITVILACVGVVIFLASRPSQSMIQEPQQPEVPDS